MRRDTSYSFAKQTKQSGILIILGNINNRTNKFVNQNSLEIQILFGQLHSAINRNCILDKQDPHFS